MAGPTTRFRHSRGVRMLAALLASGLLAAPGVHAQSVEPLSAQIRLFDVATARNAYPDECGGRLDRLYIAEGLDLGIQVQFNHELSDAEQQQVQWTVSDAASPSSGDFVGQPNPATVTTTLTTGDSDARDVEATVNVMYQGADIATPARMRVITDREYDAAYASLAGYAAVGGRPRSQLPLTTDLLARFLGQPSGSAAVGTPTLATYPLNICDPRLTHRAGADWGAETVADVPLVHFTADQPVSTSVAEGVVQALVAQHAAAIQTYFEQNPAATTLSVKYPYSGNLTLNRPLDAALSLHGVDFDGSLTATVDAPGDPRGGARGPLTARAVQVQGTVTDLYDFALQATGGAALPASEAAKVEIASVKHDGGKIFVVSFDLDNTFDTLAL
jgi:hypothetical protein